MRPNHWVPPLAWMALILWLASDSGSAEQTSRIVVPLLRFIFPAASPLQIEAMHGLVRKLGHFTEYAILAGLWARALAAGHGLTRRSAAWGAWAIATAWAVIDESYQSTVASRTGSAVDVTIDTAGALAVAVSVAFGWRTVDVLTTVLLWIAALGGSVLLAVNVATDVASGALWLTVPVAFAVCFWRWRKSR